LCWTKESEVDMDEMTRLYQKMDESWGDRLLAAAEKLAECNQQGPQADQAGQAGDAEGQPPQDAQSLTEAVNEAMREPPPAKPQG